MISTSLVTFFQASPLLLLAVGALVILILDSFLPGKSRVEMVTAIFIAGALVNSALSLVWSAGGAVILKGLLFSDPYSVFCQVLFLSAALLSCLCLGEESAVFGQSGHKSSFYALFLVSCAGALIFISAAELVTLFMGLEIMSIALYAMCGSSLRVRASGEAALKYFILGSFSSAFMLYGASLIYGTTTTTFIPAISEMLQDADTHLVVVAMCLFMFGLLFKVGAVPFHFWLPDAYQGAPTSVTVFMASAIKVAAVSVALRALWVIFPHETIFWSEGILLISVLSMTAGNLMAIAQRSLKRMLAWSSVAHGGYILVAFLAKGQGGGEAVLYYLAAYSLMTIGAFSAVLSVTRKFNETAHPDDISRFYGLAKIKPGIAALFALFLLSLAGVPPGFAGLIGKFYVFSSAISATYTKLVVIGVLNSAVSVYYYLRVIVAMYFLPPVEGENYDLDPSGASLYAVLGVCALGVILFGLFPESFHQAASVVISML